MSTPKFTNPPIVELVLGVQFDRLPKLSSAHLGRYWQDLGAEWSQPSDAQPIEEAFETFGQDEWAASVGFSARLSPVLFPGRMIIGHQDGTRVLQVQATRFHFNWRKREQFYPSYHALIGEFQQKFQDFSRFVVEHDLGTLKLNQWELTYVDAFFKGEDWEAVEDWPHVLPGLFGELASLRDLRLSLERTVVRCTGRLADRRGRLHLSAESGRVPWDDRPALLLRTTCRGPLSASDARALRDGLDLGHQAALGAFLKITADELKQKWGERHVHLGSDDR